MTGLTNLTKLAHTDEDFRENNDEGKIGRSLLHKDKIEATKEKKLGRR